MRDWSLGLALAFVALPALAQAPSDCHDGRFFRLHSRCEVRTGSDRIAPPAERATLICSGVLGAVTGCTFGRLGEPPRVSAFDRSVENLIAAGRCPDALRLALEQGTLSYTQRVAGMCEAPAIAR